MLSFLAISPLLFCAGLIVGLRYPPLKSAFASLILAIVISSFISRFHIALPQWPSTILSAFYLTCNAAMIIIPGLYFNAMLKSHGTDRLIEEWIAALPFSDTQKVLIMIMGFLPAVESLTGFGVSLFFSIPIFFSMFEGRKALKLAMMGLNITPWATLALSTQVGAEIAHMPPSELGFYSALCAAPIFPVMAITAVLIIEGKKGLKNTLPAALGMSMGMIVCLILLNKLGLTDIAGVLSGLLMCIAGLIFMKKQSISPKSSSGETKRIQRQISLFSQSVNALTAFYPYLMVLSLIIIEHSIPGFYPFLSHHGVMHGQNTIFRPLNNPGLVLFAVTIFLYLKEPARLPHCILTYRIFLSCGALFGFIFLSQVMSTSNMITYFSNSLSALNTNFLLALSPLIGMCSSFLTGSNLSGNALTMAMQAHLGHQVHLPVLFASAQNAGAGLAFFTALPIIVLLLTLAKDYLPAEKAIAERTLILFGIKIAGLLLTGLIIILFILKSISLPI